MPDQLAEATGALRRILSLVDEARQEWRPYPEPKYEQIEEVAAQALRTIAGQQRIVFTGGD